MTEILIVALTIFGYAMFSERLSMSPVTAPMVFTTVGLVVGTGGLGVFDVQLESESTQILIEVTLALVLFTDAIRIDLGRLRRQSWFPLRLLGVGLPLSFLIGLVAAALLFPSLPLAEAALLAAALAPTDAALGQAVVSDLRLPARLRQGLNVESGLNDGIALPLVTVALAVAAAEASTSGLEGWQRFAAEQVGFGVLVGAGVGAVGGALLHQRASAGRVEPLYRQLAALSVLLAAYSGAVMPGGNGFIAAFCAGLAFGHVAPGECDNAQDFTEDEGELLTAITFLVFGAVLVGPRLGDLTWQVGAYVALSLVVVRGLAVLVSLLGSGLRLETRVFAAWFGPRGLASILFALLIVDELDSPGADLVYLVVVWTVLVSVFAHGLSAAPWAGRLARRLADEQSGAPELGEVPDMPTRRRLAP
ncbi:MAG: cation:proton antiporter [Microthrixaceae bacterium]